MTMKVARMALVALLVLLALVSGGAAEARRGRGRAAKLFDDEASFEQHIAEDENNVVVGNEEEESRSSADRGYNRDKRVIGIFNLFRFANGPCNQTNGEGGVCYSESECSALGGTNGGPCASPVGVCCGFSLTCGQTSSQNCTYFASTDTDTSPCTATICRASGNICQLRLDFVAFDIAQPDGTTAAAPFTPTTQCLDAKFTVTSDGNAPPTICGTNTGEHMIVEADPACNQLSFSWTNANPRNWRIKVNQISCLDPNKPPEGCTQFFTGETGTIRSYNFAGGIHLANQNYDACIRTEEGFCTIQYSETPSTTFDVSTMSTDKLSAVGEKCTLDYIVIRNANAVGSPTPTADRFCGQGLTDPNGGMAALTTTQQPFVVGFRTNAGEGGGSNTAPETLDSQSICGATDNICQLRLDFEMFMLAAPDTTTTTTAAAPRVNTQETNCLAAQFNAETEDGTAPTLCGNNNGQHMIVEYQDGCNDLTFSWTDANPRSWRIKVTQIACTDPNKPPENCRQYFTGTTGTVQSYNFAGGVHLANHNYQACIRAEANQCAIEWSSATGDFQVSSQPNGANDAVNNFGDLCQTDYVLIPGGRGNNQSPLASRYCGSQGLFRVANPLDTSAEGTVVSTQRPFRLGFVSNEGENTLNDAASKGFKLSYTQTTMCDPTAANTSG